MAVRNRFLPADRLIVGYNVLLALVWMFPVGQGWLGPIMSAWHVGLALLPMAVVRIDPARSKLAAGVRYIYPMALVAIYWLEMGLIRTTFHGAAYDDLIIAAEMALFGQHLHIFVADLMPWAWMAEAMSTMYVLYYPMVFVTPAVMVAVRKPDAARDMVFALAVAYLACYVFYIFFPVDGPKVSVGRVGVAATEAVAYGIVDALVKSGDSLGTAFPSSHVVGAVVMAFLAFRWMGRVAAWIFGIEAAGVMASTVYAQHHFLLDMVVGFGAALAIYFALVPALKKVLGRETSPGEAASAVSAYPPPG